MNVIRETKKYKKLKGSEMMAVLKSVENGVQAKAVIEAFIKEGYDKDHIHVFANSNKRAEDIAKFFDVDSGKSPTTDDETTGFFSSIKNLFQTTPDDFLNNLGEIGATETDKEIAQKDLNDGKLVIFAHHPEL